MKTIQRFLLSVLLVLCMTVTAWAATYDEDGLRYTISNGSITIVECFDNESTVVVPETIGGYPVTKIASGAFANNTYVKRVVLPGTITSIESGAFGSGVSYNKQSSKLTVNNTSYRLTPLSKAFSLGAKAKTTISYQSSNTAVATVSASGQVTPKGVGQTTITVSSAASMLYEAESKQITITVEKAPQTISGNSNFSKSVTSKAFSLGASVNTKQKLTYASSNTKVAAVNTTGTVTIKGAGTAVITIKAAGSSVYQETTKTVTITVSKLAQSISGVGSHSKTVSSKSFYLNTKAKTPLTYRSSDTKVVTVNSKGLVTIKGSGTATITVKASASATYREVSRNITVTVKKLSQSISGTSSYKKTINSSAFTLNTKGKTTLSYQSSNPKVATVSSKGRVTIQGVGSAVIQVQAASSSKYNSATKTVTITVTKASQTITCTSSFRKTKSSKPFRLGAKAKTKLSYQSSNTKVVTVSDSGIVTVVGKGKATITVIAAANDTYYGAVKKVTVTVS